MTSGLDCSKEADREFLQVEIRPKGSNKQPLLSVDLGHTTLALLELLVRESFNFLDDGGTGGAG